MNLFKVNKRDVTGFLAWLVVSLIVGLFSLPIMIFREVYQWKHYHLKRFELEDVIRYGLVILIGSLVKYLVLMYE